MDSDESQILDEWLVIEAQCGDRQCLELLVDRWAHRVRGTACRLTGDEAGGEEVAQESWAAVARGLTRLRDPALFGPWVRGIVRRKAADWIAARKRQRSHGSVDGSFASPESANASESEDIARLRGAIRKLPDDRRAALFLLYVEGLSVGQIASLFDAPRGTIKSRLHQARAELRSLLESEGDRHEQHR